MAARKSPKARTAFEDVIAKPPPGTRRRAPVTKKIPLAAPKRAYRKKSDPLNLLLDDVPPLKRISASQRKTVDQMNALAHVVHIVQCMLPVVQEMHVSMTQIKQALAESSDKAYPSKNLRGVKGNMLMLPASGSDKRVIMNSVALGRGRLAIDLINSHLLVRTNAGLVDVATGKFTYYDELASGQDVLALGPDEELTLTTAPIA